MPLGLSGCCQDRETLFRDVFSFLMTVTGEGAGGRQIEKAGEALYGEVQGRFSQLRFYAPGDCGWFLFG